MQLDRIEVGCLEGAGYAAELSVKGRLMWLPWSVSPPLLYDNNDILYQR